jgi:hypothetical protein
MSTNSLPSPMSRSTPTPEASRGSSRDDGPIDADRLRALGSAALAVEEANLSTGR